MITLFTHFYLAALCVPFMSIITIRKCRIILDDIESATALFSRSSKFVPLFPLTSQVGAKRRGVSVTEALDFHAFSPDFLWGHTHKFGFGHCENKIENSI